MRLKRTERWAVCTLVALTLGNVKVLAQPDSATARRESHEAAAQRPAPSVVSLQTLVVEVLEQNPEIIAMRRNFDMMRARVPQAKAWPEPMLNYSYAGNAVPLPPFDIHKGDPSSARMFSLTQEIPYPGKLAIKGKMANVAAESEWWNYEQVQWNIVAEVKDAYYDLYYLHKAIETVIRNKDLLEKFTKIALPSGRNFSSPNWHVQSLLNALSGNCDSLPDFSSVTSTT